MNPSLLPFCFAYWRTRWHNYSALTKWDGWWLIWVMDDTGGDADSRYGTRIKLHDSFFEKRAVLIRIRPLKVGSRFWFLEHDGANTFHPCNQIKEISAKKAIYIFKHSHNSNPSNCLPFCVYFLSGSANPLCVAQLMSDGASDGAGAAVHLRLPRNTTGHSRATLWYHHFCWCQTIFRSVYPPNVVYNLSTTRAR